MIKSQHARAASGAAPETGLAPQQAAEATPIFQRIKDYLLEQIAAGVWKEGDVIPSEQALVKQFGVSRMTCLLYTSPSPRDATLSRMPSSA